jgi:hypothetical protein
MSDDKEKELSSRDRHSVALPSRLVRHIDGSDIVLGIPAMLLKNVKYYKIYGSVVDTTGASTLPLQALKHPEKRKPFDSY